MGMEATARVPGKTGTRTGTGAAGEHVHRLLSLAAALTAAAGTATTASAANAASAAAAGTATTASAAAAGGTAAADAGAVGGAGSELLAAPLGVALDSLSDAQSVAWARDLESLSRVLAALQVQAAGDLAARARAGRYDGEGATSPADLLTTTLRVGRAEANRRLRLAKQFLPVTDPLTTATTAPAQPVLADAFFSGALSAELALMASSHVGDAAHLARAGRIGQDDVDRLEATLAGYARIEGPDFLRPVATRALDLLDPDGQQPTEGELTAKQGLFFHRPRRGLIHYDGYLTIVQYEALMAAIGWATNPNRHKDINTLNTTMDGPDKNRLGGGPGSAGAGNDGAAAEPPTTDRGGDKSGVRAGGVLPGQADLLDILGVAAAIAPPHARPPAPTSTPETSWPPPQGPPPHWAQSADTTTHGTPANAGNATEAATNDANEAATDGATNGANEAATNDATEAATDDATNGANEAATHDGAGSDGPPDSPGTTCNDGLPKRPGAAGNDGAGAPCGGKESAGSASAFWAAPGVDPSPGGGADSSRCPGAGVPAQWPHLVDGIMVPEPGSTHELEGLDPIDPACTDRAVQDRRTNGQQLLDGLIDAVKLAARTGLLPVNGGLKPQLLISTTEADLQASRARGTGGIAFLPYTGPNNLALFATELCDADVTTMILGDGTSILNVGRTQRLFTDAQRKILAARDIGCTFPHCTRAAAKCDAHHVVSWQDGGETNISNGCLLCAYHHTLIHQGHWTLRLVNGTPYYTPAYSIDPTRTERRNTYHHGLTNAGR